MADGGALRQVILDIPEHIREAEDNEINLYETELLIAKLERDINSLNLLLDRLQGQEEILSLISELKRKSLTALDHLENNTVRPFQNHQYGRPRIEISAENILSLYHLYKSWKIVAIVLRASERTLRRRRQECGLPVSNRSGPRENFTNIDQERLKLVVSEVLELIPDAGETIVIGALRARGIHVQRLRIRNAIMEIDPVGRLSRRRHTIVRRVYNVMHPNELWHIDGHHKLIRWRFVIHGGIDGFSRMITFLHCNNNNRAETVLELFRTAVETHGIPSRVRSDMGVENTQVSMFMLTNRGLNRASMIVGSSVHNQRIERLWLDVKRLVVRNYSAIFYALEDQNLLDPLREDHLFALHLVFLPLINNSLEELTNDWNNHPLSSENNLSPMRLWHLGLENTFHVDFDRYNHLFGQNPEEYGIDEDGPMALDEDNEVSVPQIDFDLEDELHEQLVDYISQNLHRRNCVDIYQYIINML